jgi:2-succinyl-5-enolpyruvyl-6-hydroxy-3-cyclohexene-1-carboxylate synthase
MPVPSARVALAVIEELMAGGVRDVVLAPGSRSAPLALALADAERRQLLRLHVRLDERSAAYLALGIARVSGVPVAVVTTSGTAAVNLHPAIVEASYSGVPLIAVTADRPGDLRASGANQTIDQRGLYGHDVVTWIDVEGLDEPHLRRLVSGSLDLAVGAQPGPVHINVPLSEPLVESGAHTIAEVEVRGREPRVARQALPLSSLTDAPGRGVLVAGDFNDESIRDAAATLATALGWPVISEPTGNLTGHPHAVRHGPLIAGSMPTPDVVVSIGRVGLHRSLHGLMRGARTHLAVDVPPYLGRVDPLLTATTILDAVPVPDGDAAPGWLASWQAADARAADAVVSAWSSDLGGVSGPVAARLLADAAGPDDLLVLGPSWPVRHVSMFAGPLRARSIGNRGTSGIDGVVSSAWGAALAHAERHPEGTTYVLLGDLTAIYDRNGLLAPAAELRPRLVYVVLDNDGGGIFSALEQGAPEFAADFERVFGTPHGAEIEQLLTAPGVEVEQVDSAAGLASALELGLDAVRVIVVRSPSRAVEAELLRSLQASVDAAVGHDLA